MSADQKILAGVIVGVLVLGLIIAVRDSAYQQAKDEDACYKITLEENNGKFDESFYNQCLRALDQ